MLTEPAIPRIIEEFSMEMKEQLEVVNMTRKTEGSHLELYKTDKNYTTQERYNIFVGKYVWEKAETSHDSPKEIDKDAATDPEQG